MNRVEINTKASYKILSNMLLSLVWLLYNLPSTSQPILMPIRSDSDVTALCVSTRHARYPLVSGKEAHRFHIPAIHGIQSQYQKTWREDMAQCDVLPKDRMYLKGWMSGLSRGPHPTPTHTTNPSHVKPSITSHSLNPIICFFWPWISPIVNNLSLLFCSET